MADINGITLKNIKEFQGREGYGAQGNIYMEGHKIGWYNNTGDGGVCDIDIDDEKARHEFYSRVKKFFKDHRNFITNADYFFSLILTLIDYEKMYKKNYKKGYDILITENFIDNQAASLEESMKTALNEIPVFSQRSCGLKLNKEEIKTLYKDKTRNPMVFMSLDDFLIP